ncbi:MAG: DUF1738 domain-containing protein [Ruminococcus sp.]|nr:DUF1738 domain-containing protein [Ruminococcus sp.]
MKNATNSDYIGRIQTITIADKTRKSSETAKKSKPDIYETITAKITEQLSAGIIPWEKPWSGDPAAARNYFSGKPYSFINQMILNRSGCYATFKQWTESGAKIRKGAKADYIYFYKTQKKETDELDENGEKIVIGYPVLRRFAVFHESDVEGVTAKPAPIPPARSVSAEKIIADYVKKSGIMFFSGISEKAYYSPIVDAVKIPDISQYKTAEAYYSTAFHELTHSTGHKTRLDREGVNAASYHPFGSEVYSREELIAEMGAAFLCSASGMETASTLKNSAAYIQSWLRALKNDKHMIVYAASRAQKAAEYILNMLDPETPDPSDDKPDGLPESSGPVTTAETPATVTDSEPSERISDKISDIPTVKKTFPKALKIKNGSRQIELCLPEFFPTTIKNLKILATDIKNGCTPEDVKNLIDYLNDSADQNEKSAELLRENAEKYDKVVNSIEKFRKTRPDARLTPEQDKMLHELKEDEHKFNYHTREARSFRKNAEWLVKLLQPTEKIDNAQPSTPAEDPKTDVTPLTLKNSVVVFSGSLKRSRETAKKAVKAAGGKVTEKVSRKTDILVLGSYEDFNAPKGEKSEKLLKAEKLIADGYNITIINEQQFIDLLRS